MTELTESNIEKLIRLIHWYVREKAEDLGLKWEIKQDGSVITIKLTELTIKRLEAALARYDQCKTGAALEDAISEDAIITRRLNDIFKEISDLSGRGVGELSRVFNIDPENETEDSFDRSINLIHCLLIARGYKVTVKGVIGHSYTMMINWK